MVPTSVKDHSLQTQSKCVEFVRTRLGCISVEDCLSLDLGLELDLDLDLDLDLERNRDRDRERERERERVSEVLQSVQRHFTQGPSITEQLTVHNTILFLQSPVRCQRSRDGGEVDTHQGRDSKKLFSFCTALPSVSLLSGVG